VRQLISLEVDQLLDQFNHRVNFPEDWSFVIIHGPNGVGKTQMLRIISAVSRANIWELESIPFSEVRLKFTDGSVLRVRRERDGSGAPDEDNDAGRSAFPISISVRGSDLGHIDWQPGVKDSPRLARALRVMSRNFAVIRIEPNLWRDQETGEEFSTREVFLQYGDMFPPELDVWDPDIPSELSSFIESIDVHVIETQRLGRRRGAQNTELPLMHRTPRQYGRDERLTVVEFGESLSRKLRDVLGENSRVAQNLDQTFPRRIIVDSDAQSMSEEEIRSEYNELNTLRTKIAGMGVLGSYEEEVPLPDGELEDWKKTVLTTYLADMRKKLEAFSPLLTKVQLFRDIVNSRFQFKELIIDIEDGLKFETESGQAISVRNLSSGEQHEIVMAYDLLFNVPEGSLVLIDEPEISLHVSWQREFLNDLSKISEAAKLRFVVATHSPQIVDKWWNRAVALIPESDAQDSGDDTDE
jgi:ABC-type lipoprotein export system ATPase subunit